jgi:hypothetical protein
MSVHVVERPEPAKHVATCRSCSKGDDCLDCFSTAKVTAVAALAEVLRVTMVMEAAKAMGAAEVAG